MERVKVVQVQTTIITVFSTHITLEKMEIALVHLNLCMLAPPNTPPPRIQPHRHHYQSKVIHLAGLTQDTSVGRQSYLIMAALVIVIVVVILAIMLSPIITIAAFTVTSQTSYKTIRNPVYQNLREPRATETTS
jgi:hypothetical protein